MGGRVESRFVWSSVRLHTVTNKVPWFTGYNSPSGWRVRLDESRERRIRKEEVKSKKVGGIETVELLRNRTERVDRASERAARLKSRVVSRKKAVDERWVEKVGKRSKGKNRKAEGNARDNEDWRAKGKRKSSLGRR